MLIIAGSFIEGVYLLANSYEKQKDPQLLGLLVEQKTYLDNIIEILQAEEGKDLMPLLKDLKQLQVIYNNAGILAPATEKKNYKRIVEIFPQLSSKIKEMRKGIIS